MKKTFGWILLFCLVLSSPVLAGGRKMGDMPAPRLVQPNDAVDLSGKNELEFRWGNETGGNFDYYDFRLYKGSQTYEKGLILKKEIPKGTTSIALDAAQFVTGQTYAWSLRFVGSSMSRSAYSIFSVKK